MADNISWHNESCSALTSGCCSCYGQCDMDGCPNDAVKVVVGDAGDLWVCADHSGGWLDQLDPKKRHPLLDLDTCPKCGGRCTPEVCECPPACLSANHPELLHIDGCQHEWGPDQPHPLNPEAVVRYCQRCGIDSVRTAQTDGQADG